MTQVRKKTPDGKAARRGIRASVCVVLTVLTALAGAWPGWAAKTAVVVADRLNVRPSPGTGEPPVASLERGTTVRVVKEHDGWLEVAFDHRSGFVRYRQRYIRMLPSASDAGSNADVTKARRKADAIATEIEKGEKALKRARLKEKAVVTRLDDIDRRLNRTRRQAAALRKEIAGLQEQIVEAGTEAQRLKDEIEKLEAYAAGRLEAYYKLQWLGTVHLLASADSLAEMIHRKAALERILAHDEALWSRLTDRRQRLGGVTADLHVRMARQRSLEDELTVKAAAMNREKTRRSAILDQIRKDKTLQLASIESLKEAQRDLEAVLRGFENRPPDLEGPPQWPEAADFAALKGLLPLPVEGKIVSRFGKYRNAQFNVYNFRSGIDIRADRGEPVRAVSAGQVLFAEWFKGYGNMMIVDHGMGYYTVYAHAEELFKQKGEVVESGEVVATVGDTGSMTEPSLYFEIRHHGKALDPSDWLNAG